LPLGDWAVVAAIAGTLVAEAAVPLLLCSRRTAYAGMALGAAFHLFLSQYGGLHGFAAMIFAFYSLFLPPAFAARVTTRLDALFAAQRLSALRPFALLASAVALLALGKMLGELGVNYTYRGLLFWDAWLVAVLVLFGRDLVQVARNAPAVADLRPRWAPMWAFPLVIFLNGLMPYVGLKTETSWAMYSNLRTEVSHNHLIVPASAKVFDYQDDLVEIVDTSLPALERYAERSDVKLTYFELRRACSSTRKKDFAVTYRRGGEERIVESVEGVLRGDAGACRAHPWVVGKLLRFRPVDTRAKATCRH
jgi:hypothetical protein